MFTSKKPITPPDKTGEQKNSQSPTPKKSKMGMVGGGIGIIIGIIVIVLLGSWAYGSIKSLFEVKERPVVQVHEKIYDVPLEGTYIYLHPGWQSDPTGEVEITNPNGKGWTDRPDTTNYPGYQPEGWYKFVAKNKPCQEKIRDVY